MKISTVRVMHDSNNKKVFEFPIDTLLDNIILDLWNDIIKYVDYHIILGANNSIYPGYRKMKKEEFDGEKIMDYYFKGSFKHIMKCHLACNYLAINNYYTKTKNGPIQCGIALSTENVEFYVCTENITKEDQLAISVCEIEFKNYYTFFIPSI